jgi:hypothetical protein
MSAVSALGWTRGADKVLRVRVQTGISEFVCLLQLMWVGCGVVGYYTIWKPVCPQHAVSVQSNQLSFRQAFDEKQAKKKSEVERANRPMMK